MANKNLFDEFVQSLDMSQKPIMCHRPSSIELAKRFFESYLTEEELCERQYTGRFWAIRGESQICTLYILIDNETYMKVDCDSTGRLLVFICDKPIQKMFLPEELKGRRYYE